MAGNREKDWGKKKVFKEGQAEQVLDTLFFDFIDLAKRLQPKVVVAENVKGLMLGEAKKYLGRVRNELESAGYYVKVFLLNASRMGVPQRRERVFVIGLRKDIAEPFLDQENMFEQNFRLDLDFSEKAIAFKEILCKCNCDRDSLTEANRVHWGVADHKGASYNTPNGSRQGFFRRLKPDLIIPTMTANCKVNFAVDHEKSQINNCEIVKGGTYPNDYDFLDNKIDYLIGMSVPPIMTAQIASRIWEQWLSKMKPNKQSRANEGRGI